MISAAYDAALMPPWPSMATVAAHAIRHFDTPCRFINYAVISMMLFRHARYGLLSMPPDAAVFARLPPALRFSRMISPAA